MAEVLGLALWKSNETPSCVLIAFWEIGVRLLTEEEEGQLGDFDSAVYRTFLGAIDSIRLQLDDTSGFWVVLDDSVWDEDNPNPIYVKCEIASLQGRRLLATFSQYPRGVTFREGSTHGLRNINEADSSSKDEFLDRVSTFIANWISMNP